MACSIAVASVSAQSRGAGRAFDAWRGGVSRRALHFTFDDGPDLQHTPPLLDELERRDIRATFFMLASKFRPAHPQSAAHIALAREIRRRGHTVASHNVTHVRIDRLDGASLRDQLDEGVRLFRSLDVGEVTWFRPPYGMMNARVLSALSSRGYRPLLWNINPRDYSEHEASAVVRNFQRQIAYRAERGERGGVVLFHDTLPWTRIAFAEIHEGLVQENCRILKEGSDEELWDIVGDVDLLSLEGPARDARDAEIRHRYESEICPER